MKNKNTEPFVIVQNPNSTDAHRVEDEVLRTLKDAGIEFDVHQTRFTDTEDNIADMIESLPDHARVISAAGDGTAEQIANASIRGKKALSVGFLPYGNYNDNAFAHMNHGQSVLDMIDEDVPVVEVKPLTFEVNGEYWRHVTSYATIGLTAIIAAGFRDEPSREKLRQATKVERSIRRYRQAGKGYVLNASNKLPDFRVDDGDILSGKTDIAVSNSPIVAGLIRSSDTYFDKSYFGVRADLNMANIFNMLSFGIPSLVGHASLDRTEAMHIAFEQAAAIPIQAGGEYENISDVESIYVFKNPNDSLKVLHPKKAVSGSSF